MALNATTMTCSGLQGSYDTTAGRCICRTGFLGAECEFSFPWFGNVLLGLSILETATLLFAMIWIVLRIAVTHGRCVNPRRDGSTIAAADSTTSAVATSRKTRPAKKTRGTKRNLIARFVMYILIVAHLARAVSNWVPSELLGIAIESASSTATRGKATLLYIAYIGWLIASNIVAVFWFNLLSNPFAANTGSFCSRGLNIVSLILVIFDVVAIVIGILLSLVSYTSASTVFTVILLDIAIIIHVSFLCYVTHRLENLESESDNESGIDANKDGVAHTVERRKRWVIRLLIVIIVVWIVNLLSHLILVIMSVSTEGALAEALKIIPASLERLVAGTLGVVLAAILDTECIYLRGVLARMLGPCGQSDTLAK